MRLKDTLKSKLSHINKRESKINISIYCFSILDSLTPFSFFIFGVIQWNRLRAWCLYVPTTNMSNYLNVGWYFYIFLRILLSPLPPTQNHKINWNNPLSYISSTYFYFVYLSPPNYKIFLFEILVILIILHIVPET